MLSVTVRVPVVLSVPPACGVRVKETPEYSRELYVPALGESGMAAEVDTWVGETVGTVIAVSMPAGVTLVAVNSSEPLKLLVVTVAVYSDPIVKLATVDAP